MKYNLLVDGRMLLGPWKLRGIAKYSLSLIKTYKDVTFLVPNSKHNIDLNNYLKFGFKSYLLWEQISLPLKLLGTSYKYILLPSTTAPVFLNTKRSILVVHDLIFLKGVNNENLKEKLSSFYRRIITVINIKYSKNIICNSEYTKKEILQNFELNKNQKITVLNCAIENYWFNENSKKQYSSNYFITVSGSLKSKNLIRTLKAFKKFNNDHNDFYVLKIIGISGNKHKRFRRILEDNILLNNVEIIPNISEFELIKLYDNARLALTLSTHEGFGIPVVEAMSRKTPIIVSNTSSLPEVAGPYAIYADPYNIDDIYNKLGFFISLSKEVLINMVKKNYIHSLRYSQSELDVKTNLFWKEIKKS